MYGTYLWPETAVEETQQLPCNFSGPNENPSATRICNLQSVWSISPAYNECYTLITMMYESFNAVSHCMCLTPIDACIILTSAFI